MAAPRPAAGARGRGDGRPVPVRRWRVAPGAVPVAGARHARVTQVSAV